MKQWRYARGWKLLAIIVSQISAIVMLLSIGVCAIYITTNGIGWLSSDQSFEDTQYYQSEVREQIYRCVRAASRESKFELGGVYNARMAVNIEEYAKKNTITKNPDTEDGVCYYLSDLLNWSLDGYTVRSADDTIEMYDRDGTVEIEALDEPYAPIGYDDITSYAAEHGISSSELQEIYNNLESALPSIYDDFFAYQQNLDLFSPSMTNLRYLIIPRNAKSVTEYNFERVTFTNIKSFGNVEIPDTDALLRYVRSYEDYLIYYSADMNYEVQNMPVTLGDINGYLNGYPPSIKGDYIFAVMIDTDYQANDVLQEYKERYEEFHPASRVAVYGVIFGSVAYLLALIYLTLASGHQVLAPRNEIILQGFDKIKTEVGMALVTVPAIALTVTGLDMLSFFSDLNTACIFEGGLVFILNALFLLGYLSLIRRVKARTLWTNSVLCWLESLVVTVLGNKKITTRMFFGYLFYLLVNYICIQLGIAGLLFSLLLNGLVGVMMLQRAVHRQRILDGIARIGEGDIGYQVNAERFRGDIRIFAEAINHMGKSLEQAMEKSIHDERMKTDLITNVSHDIKTPLTSIINYVEILKRSDIQDESTRGYLDILESKAMRLKHLTEDLVEASKISSGTLQLDTAKINFQEIIHQACGEFSEKFEARGLQMVVSAPEEAVMIEADGRRLWRVIENLYLNAVKYAMENTRVYIELVVVGHMVRFHIKNISEQPLNINADQLTERFVRGDVSRSTEGSGLGLSIAKSLTELQKGTFGVYLDGDLFKVTIIFPMASDNEEILAISE